jgi:hypothetical protein
MTKVKMTTLAAALLGMGMASTAALAGSSDTVDGFMSRIDPDAASGDKVSTVRNNCGGGVDGYDDATAEISISQKASSSKVEVELEGGKPNTLYTVWVRLQGSAHGGANNGGTTFGGSPITGGGATPLAHTDALAQLVADWIGPGSPTQPNGFITNADGEGKFKVDLDFPVVGGAYPFNRMSHDTHLLAATKNPAAWPNPTAIVNPADAGIGGPSTPFMIRVISHCQDGLGHGLSPAKREAWFQYP